MNRILSIGILSLLLVAWRSDALAETPPEEALAKDLALQPAHVIVSPWKQHIPPTKRQGVAGIECTSKGRLWVVYGRDVESTRNFQVVRSSDDRGESWSEVRIMILPRQGTRAMSA